MKLRLKWIQLEVKLIYFMGRLKGKYICENCEEPISRKMVLGQIIATLDRSEMICQECVDEYKDYAYEGDYDPNIYSDEFGSYLDYYED